jgi:O-acetyl-ADP-ribose deacetylase (regulator of RNase III)
MTLYYRKISIFDSPMQTLVVPVNCVGVMGAGLALAFANKYPECVNGYKAYCKEKLLAPGKIILSPLSENKYVLFFPTKDHWKNPSKIEYIQEGLEMFVKNYKKSPISSVSFPKLGCGRGGLDWEDVQPIMHEALKDLLIDIYIHI